VNLANDEEESLPFARFRIGGQISSLEPPRNLERRDVDPGEQDGIEDVGRRVLEKDIAILDANVYRGCPERGEFEKEIVLRKRNLYIEHETSGRSQKPGNEIPRM